MQDFAGRAEYAEQHTIDGVLDISVIEHDRGGLAAELQRDRHQLLGSEPRERPARRRPPGERNLFHQRVLHDCIADHRALARQDAHHPLGDACLLADATELEGEERGHLRRLDDDSIACRERRGELLRLAGNR